MIIFRALVTVFAVMLILVGFIITPTPLPIGLLFIALGFLLLATVAPEAVRWIRRRWPWLERQLDKAQEKAPEPIAKILRRSDPPHDDEEEEDDDNNPIEDDPSVKKPG